MYSVKDVEQILGVSHNTAYKLIKLKGFPSIQIGRKIIVPKDEFDKWVEKSIGKTIHI